MQLPKVKPPNKARVRIAKRYIRLIGEAINSPSDEANRKLGKHIAAHPRFFLDLILNATMTGGVWVELHDVYKKYVLREKE